MRVTSEIHGLNALLLTATNSMEVMRAMVGWMASKTELSTFDFIESILQIELGEDSRDCTAFWTLLWLLSYLRLP